jgi:signal transduction histidine kinase/ActR/RegA family two-component response regulator
MSMPTPSLKEFAQAIPVCEQTTGFSAMLEIFRSSGCDAIIVVSEQQRPLGVISLRQVLPYLIGSAQSEESPVARATGDFNKPLSQLEPPIIEPLRILSAQLSLSQFWTYLQQTEDRLTRQERLVEEDHNNITVRPRGHNPRRSLPDTGGSEAASTLGAIASGWYASHVADQRPAASTSRSRSPLEHWALVDEEGKFLGLLDSWLLLKSLAPRLSRTNSVPFSYSSRRPTPSSLDISASSSPSGVANPFERTARHAHDLPTRTANPERGGFGASTAVPHSASRAACALSVGSPEQQLPSTSIELLVQLLEQLPIPLSLQTSTGQVVAENLTWRQQIGPSPDLDGVRHTAALRLEAPPVELRSALRSSAVSDPPIMPLHSSTPIPDSTLRERSSAQVHELKTPKQQTALCSSPGLDAATRLQLSLSPLAVQNGGEKWHESLNRTSVVHHCAINTSCIAATVLQHQVKFSALPLLKTPETPTDWEESASVSETKKQSQDRVFSFLKIPLLPLSLKKGTERQTLTASPAQPLPSNLHLVIAQDTTEQQQVAQELAAKNADLIHLNRLKDEFLACISHELKTPLTAVLGLSTLLKDQTLGALNERQARYARLIYQSGRQLMTVVNDILDLTRMETGQIELTLEPVHVHEVCDRAYAQARQRPMERDQEEESLPETQFTLEIEPGLDLLIADELRLRQMLAHLLSNALKFTDPGGEIGLRVNRWEGWIALTVWDTGIGIPPEKQHLIFQKFQQLEQPLTRRFEGTGLGLVLAQRLARMHGGDISFISKPGEGSQFTLLLPPCPPQVMRNELNVEDGLDLDRLTVDGSKVQRSKVQPATSESRNSLVLIVETVPQYLESLTQQLRNLGYHAVIARSGTEAIEKARSLQPCAILLNPLLPQLSGWDVLTLLKSDSQTLHIPVLVTATQAEKAQAYDNKADGFLSLPVQEPALLECLTGLSDKHKTTKRNLTILYLNPEDIKAHPSSSLSTELTEALSLQHSELNYRVLEADDLEQAELLARVWHPDVVLLDSAGLAAPLTYMQQYSQHPGLISLPLVTLDRQTTEAANQVSGLCVYPCLALDESSKLAALLQVIQVAAGMSRKPNILVMNIGEQGRQDTGKPAESKLSTSSTVHSSWLQALMQYLQTAGFRSLLSCSWTEVYRQLQEQSVDLLLIRLKDINDTSALVNDLNSLAQLAKTPPIFVLDHRSDTHRVSEAVSCVSKAGKGSAQHQPLGTAKQQPKDSMRFSVSEVGKGNAQVADSVSVAAATELAVATSGASPLAEALGSSNLELESLLRGVATQIWSGPSQSMSELLEQIDQTLSVK